MLRRLWDRLVAVILDQLKQGLAPSPAAWAVALGIYIAIIPALGTTVLLCLLLGSLLRLNQPILQAVNWVAYPLQFVFIFPFYALGARLFNGPVLTLSPAEFAALATSDPLKLMRDFWWVGMHGIAVWAVIGTVVVPSLWAIFNRLFSRLASPETHAI